MTPRVLLPLLTLGATAAMAGNGAPATAQCALPIELVDIDGESISTANQRPVSAAECAAGATVTYRITGTPTANTMDFYVGGGDTCNLSDERQKIGTNCVLISTTMIIDGVQNPEYTVTLGDDVCGTAGTESDVPLWFLAVDLSGGSADVSTCANATLSVDLSPPVAPTSLNAPRGENSLELTWSPPTDSEINRYVVFIDQNPDEDCASSTLTAGESLDLANLPEGVVTQSVQGATARSSSFSASLVPNGDAAVAVSAQDLAGNVGLLSEVSCAKVVPTDGFWDVYKAGGGEADASGGCSALGGHAAGFFSPALLTLFGLRLRNRRRNS